MPKSKDLRDEVPEEIQKAFREIYKLCKNEDKELRNALVKQWKKHEEFWHGVQYIFWSERDSTWISPVDTNWREGFTDEELEEIGPFYDYVINNYAAHGQSIIAAMAAQLPSLRFIPDDATNPDDLVTSRTYNVIADLICRHNKAKLMSLRALFYAYNGGIWASYRYKDADVSYGTYKVPKFENQEVIVSHDCPDCGYSVPVVSVGNDPGSPVEAEAEAEAEKNTESSDGKTGGAVSTNSEEEPAECPECGSQLEPHTEEQPVQTSTEVLPKTRVKVDIIGPLFFKTNYYAIKQSDCTYFIYWRDLPKSSVKAVYCSDFRDSELSREIDGERLESLDRFSRSGHAYPNDPVLDESELVTVSKIWLRPSEYWKCKKEEVRLQLAEKYPDGAEVTFIGKNDVFAEASSKKEDMFDVKWEIGQAGLATYLISDAIGRPYMPVQEMENQLANLTMDVIDHSNPATFADPEVLNFEAFGSQECKPGYYYPVKPKGQLELEKSFFQPTRTQLGKEVVEFNQELSKAGQFVLGDFPSLYGGSGSNTSRTAKEYEQSRAMALQRLTIHWTLFVDWFVRTIEGAVRTYAQIVSEDERFTKWDNGNYINVWIRMAELKGKVGGVESEASEQFPVSLMQKKALLLELIQMQIPEINMAIYTPDNARILQDALALNEFKLPGEAQRLKQVIEIGELTRPDAVPIDEMNSSVPIDIEVDDDAVHIAVIKNWAVDTPGLDCMKLQPAQYMNVILHMKAHQLNLMKKTMQAMPAAPPGQPPATSEPPVE